MTQGESALALQQRSNSRHVDQMWPRKSFFVACGSLKTLKCLIMKSMLLQSIYLLKI